MILGIDASLKGTGFAWRGKGIETQVIGFKSSNTGEQLSLIRDHLESLIIKNNITYAVREGYAYAFNNWGKTKLEEVGGVMKMVLYEKNIPYIEVAPKSLKKLITGNGNATKQDVMNSINSLLNLSIVNDNESDAASLMIIGECYLNVVNKFGFEFGSKKVSEVSYEIQEMIAKGVI
jgi:crossover junction endodeoxyribonuclease RuvC